MRAALTGLIGCLGQLALMARTATLLLSHAVGLFLLGHWRPPRSFTFAGELGELDLVAVRIADLHPTEQARCRLDFSHRDAPARDPVELGVEVVDEHRH